MGACYTCLLGVTFVAFMTVLIRADIYVSNICIFIRSGNFGVNLYMPAQTANQKKLDRNAWSRMNHKNIEKTFRENINHDTKDKEKNAYAVKEDGWKDAFLSSEWKNAHYLGKIYRP